MPKYIFVSGGVISGIGKGIAAASVAVLLKSHGLKITMIKADPYLNIDAGTMNPLEHGETYVLEEGFETDMDIGSYERFTGEIFGRMNSMTCGAVLDSVLKFERALAYDGKWVSMDYHVPQAMIKWINLVASESKADVVIIEIGGTVGEIGNQLFLEANRVLKVHNPNDVAHIHVSYLPIPRNLGEMKSKPVQISTKLLNIAGINPDFIIARSDVGIDDVRKEKLSMYCTVKKENVISAPDVESIYDVPINFHNQNLDELIIKQLGLPSKKTPIYSNWEKKVQNIKSLKKTAKIAIVGKYYKSGKFDLKDSYVSVIEAVNHACWDLQVKPDVHWIVADGLEKDENAQKELKSMDGIIVPQGWGSRGVEGKIKAVQIARENKIPYLGLCFGMQMAVIEFARNVLGMEKANSEEADPDTKFPVIHMMEEQKKHIKMKNFGGTIRLGAWPCAVKSKSLLEKLYKENRNDLFDTLPIVQERHRHRYEFNNEYREQFEKNGLIVSGSSPDRLLVEAVELDTKVHPFFVGTQYHPELKTQFLRPHPIFLGFVKQVMKS